MVIDFRKRAVLRPTVLPILARITGPGPAHYLLPTTVGRNSVDLTKRQSPAFSFGSRSFSIKSDSPGPAYLVDPLLGSKGKENTPSFSFGGRPKTPGRRDRSPGPGAYNTDVKPFWEKNAPKYSLSPRNKMRPVDPVPSPSAYEIPTTIGAKVPHAKGGTASSIVGKNDYMSYNADLARTPGPAYYPSFSPNLVKRKSPEFTIKGRNYINGNKNPTPGPGAYSPQDVQSHMPNSPRHVIGVKHSEFKMPTLTLADISN